jgi:glycosyltransferase involved in cell wall biosynthesis
VRVSFLIPAFNEERTIRDVLDGIEALGIDRQIIVVDDGSGDGTASRVESWKNGKSDVLLIRKPNGGKGSALRAAIPHIDGDIAVIQDADMEYDPAEVPALIAPIKRGVADVVYGSRLAPGRPQRAYLFWHLAGNKFLSLLTGVLYNTTSRSSRRSPRRSASESYACTRCRSRTTDAATTRARRSRGAMKITWRDGFKAIWVLRIRTLGV